MTSVVGFDIGAAGSKIGAARNRGVDVLANETSNRATPSLVSFGQKARAIGENAKTQEISNYKNTVGSLKRLIGRQFSDPDVQEVEKKFVTAELVDAKGTVGLKVRYAGEQQVFSATQLYAMYLGKLRDTASAEIKIPVNDVVIAVPGWYTDVQRRAVRDAAEIANLNVLRLINDLTATALQYGITKTDLPEAGEKPRHVAFVDIGHSDFGVAIVAFNKGQLVVKSQAYDRHFGGRDFDYALLEHFAEEFKGKYKIDVKSNQKAIFRLLTSVEKLKKVLSANAQATLNVESIMNDVDASSALSREELEKLVAPLLDRTEAPLQQALAEAKISKEDLDAVELVGGSTRVPALKNRIQEFFGKPLSFTSNQDESVVRGATLACASLSPVFRVREFSSTDVTLYPIDIHWEKTPGLPEDEGTSLRVFDKLNTFPSTKALTFYRKEPFELEARYADPSTLPGGINPFIARYLVKGVTPKADGDFSQIKVKARLNLDGVLNFESATLLEEIEVEAAAPTGADAMDTDAPKAEGDAAAPAKKAKKTLKKELPAVVASTSLDPSIVNELREKEGQMHASDKLVAETEDRKNALEEYIYDRRSKIDGGALSSYITSDEKQKFQAGLQEAEDWLYSEEGEDATKSAYVEKLDGLKKIGDPVDKRYRETELRPHAVKQLREVLQDYRDKATSGDEKYSHLPEADITKVVETVANAEKWLDDNLARQAEQSKNQNPKITAAEITKKKDDVIYTVSPIITKPKPRAPEPPKEAPKQEAPKQEQGQPEATPEADMADGTQTAPEGEAKNMDVD